MKDKSFTRNFVPSAQSLQVVKKGMVISMINPAKLFKLKSTWDQFRLNHPKFAMFLKAVKNDATQEGTLIEITVTTESGKSTSSNLKISKSDTELFKEIADLLDL